MLRFLFTRSDGVPAPSARKTRLFAVACCRRVAGGLTSEIHHQALAAAERYADAPPGARGTSRWRTRLQPQTVAGVPAQGIAAGIECATGRSLVPTGAHPEVWVNVYDTRYVVNAHWWCLESVYQTSVGREPPDRARWTADRAAEERAQSALLRCICGHPFRPVAFDSTWRTSDAVALARGIYDDHAFDRMPILADALQDAGCNSDAVLNHCRDADTPHARGCWVVDHVLGRS